MLRNESPETPERLQRSAHRLLARSHGSKSSKAAATGAKSPGITTSRTSMEPALSVGLACQPGVCANLSPRLPIFRPARIVAFNTTRPGWLRDASTELADEITECCALDGFGVPPLRFCVGGQYNRATPGMLRVPFSHPKRLFASRIDRINPESLLLKCSQCEAWPMAVQACEKLSASIQVPEMPRPRDLWGRCSRATGPRRRLIRYYRVASTRQSPNYLDPSCQCQLTTSSFASDLSAGPIGMTF
jgi:hypothetical protein